MVNYEAVVGFLSKYQSVRIWVYLICVSLWKYHPQFVLVICQKYSRTQLFLDRKDHNPSKDLVDTVGQ